MMKLRRGKRKLNNSGMTLVEILIAMTIVAVAVVPLLYGFVYIAKFSAKGREVQHATVLAQTVMENSKAYSVEEMVTEIGTNTFLNGSSNSYVDDSQATVDGSYSFYMTGVQKENKQYGVSVKLQPYGDTKKNVFQYENMNPTLDGIFIAQTTEGDSGKTSVEFEAYAFEQAFQVIADSINAITPALADDPAPVPVTASDIRNALMSDSSNANYGHLKVERNIIVTAYESSGSEIALVKYIYAFSLTGDKYEYELDDGTTADWAATGMPTYEDTYTIYKNAGTYDATHATELNDIYLFYYPAYSNSAYTEYPCVSDTFALNNSLTDETGSAKAINVYMIKQLNPAMNETAISIAESTYDAKVNGSGNVINLYHNLDTNIANASGVTSWDSGDISLTSTNINPSTAYVETEQEQLMYTVDIKIYENASYDATTKVMSGDLVLTLDGTKMDW